MHRLTAMGLVGDSLLTNFGILAALSLMPSITFTGRVETVLLEVLQACEIPNTVLDDLVGIAALAINLIINMVAN
jgi:hypothetical protein